MRPGFLDLRKIHVACRHVFNMYSEYTFTCLQNDSLCKSYGEDEISVNLGEGLDKVIQFYHACFYSA